MLTDEELEELEEILDKMEKGTLKDELVNFLKKVLKGKIPFNYFEDFF